MRVLKFGGTSVGSAENIRKVAELINTGEQKLVVLSAMSGTTDKLLQIAGRIKNKEIQNALELIDGLKDRYVFTANQLLKNNELKQNYETFLNNTFNSIHPEKSKSEKEIAAIGELITTQLFQLYLNELNIDSALIPALEFVRTDENQEPDMPYIRENLLNIINKTQRQLYITQGYICRNYNGGIDNLGRGGSDFTATILGAAAKANEIEIWSDIDGLHNNDPRFVEKTKCVPYLTYEEAEELAYFGAKVLHPTCILPAKCEGIPVRLKNTMNPAAAGTFITSASLLNGYNRGFKAIAAKDGITAIKIESGRMLQAYGFLKKIFEIFDQHKTSVDMITTSEVSVSMTIDNTTHLNSIVEELEKIGNVEVFHDQTIICVVGNLNKDGKGILLQIIQSLKSIPIHMISYGSSQNNATMLIHNSHKREALNLLSSNLFN